MAVGAVGVTRTLGIGKGQFGGVRYSMATKKTMGTCDHCKKPKDKCECNDTIVASMVRAVGGDDAAEDFKAIFGTWF